MMSSSIVKQHRNEWIEVGKYEMEWCIMSVFVMRVVVDRSDCVLLVSWWIW